jgi:hypothetical protein
MPIPTPQDLARAARSGRLEAVQAVLNSGLGREQPAELGLGLAMACFLGHRDIVRELVKRGAPLNLPPALADASPLVMSIKGGQKKTTRLLIALGAKVPAGVDTGLSPEEYEEALSKARERAARRVSRHKAASTRAPRPAPVAPAQVASTPVASAQVAPAPVAPAPGAPAPVAPAPVASAPVAPAPVPPNMVPSASAPSAAKPAPHRVDTLPVTPLPQGRQSPPNAKPEGQAAPPAARRSRGGIMEEIELTACFGVDTNVLDADLMRMNATDAPVEPPPLDAPCIDFDKGR